MEHTNYIKNQEMYYSSFTKNPMTSQISSNKFRLQSRCDFQTTYQTEQFYEKTLKKIKLQCQVTVKTHKSEYKQQNKSQQKYEFFQSTVSKTVSTKINYYFLNLLGKHFPNEVSFISKVISFIVFHVVVIESFSNLLHFFSSLYKFVILFCKC